MFSNLFYISIFLLLWPWLLSLFPDIIYVIENKPNSKYFKIDFNIFNSSNPQMIFNTLIKFPGVTFNIQQHKKTEKVTLKIFLQTFFLFCRDALKILFSQCIFLLFYINLFQNRYVKSIFEYTEKTDFYPFSIFFSFQSFIYNRLFKTQMKIAAG